MEKWSIWAVFLVTVLLLRILAISARGSRNHLGSLILLAGNLGLAVWALAKITLGERPLPELILATFVAFLLVGLPMLLDALARRAFLDERIDRAARLLSIRELFAPGRASTAERELYQQLASARAGKADDVVRTLRRHLVESEPPDSEAIKERIVTVLVYARRIDEALDQFERHLAGEPGRYPGLSMQMVAAYAERGDVHRAAELVQRLEESLSPEEPAGQAVLLQVRLSLLAGAGERRAVERLLGLEPLVRMQPQARAKLQAMAQERAQLRTDQAVNGGTDPVDEPLSRYLEAVAERAALDVRAATPAVRTAPRVTLALCAINVLCFIAFLILLGSPDGGDHLVRGGASFHPAVKGGEWWRLWTAMFLHGGWLHLFFNVYGLYLLGRLVEPALGPLRFFVVYGAAGLAGNLASLFNPSPEAVFSLGASGAVLGVMGALMVMLILRRGVWPEPWRKSLLLNLAMLLALQIAVAFTMPNVDNFAHVGGLLCGGALAILVGGGGLLGRGVIARGVVLSLALMLGTSAAWSIVSLAREDANRTVARLPRPSFSLNGVTVQLAEGSRKMDKQSADDEESLLDRAGGLSVIPAVMPVGGGGGEGEAIGKAEKEDAEELAKETEQRKMTLHIESAPAPEVAGWTQAGQRAGELIAIYYYARSVGPGRVLLLRFLHQGDGAPRSEVIEELKRVLSTAKADEAAK